jgi:[acyl-carrier-protein] S-malonyltransferase
VPVYGNVEAQPLTSVEAIRDELDRQLTNSVRWTETIQHMHAAGLSHYVELGPKDVLTGLLKRISKEATGTALNSAAAVTAFVAD